MAQDPRALLQKVEQSEAQATQTTANSCQHIGGQGRAVCWSRILTIWRPDGEIRERGGVVHAGGERLPHAKSGQGSGTGV